jgi:hypothetical protein
MRMTRHGTTSLVAAVALLAMSFPMDVMAGSRQAAGAAGTAVMVAGQDTQAAQAAQNAASGDGQDGLSDAAKQGIGCIVSSGASTIYATFAGGATETLMVAAGGMLVASATPTLWLGLLATLVAGTCSLGAVATPAVLWAAEQKDNIGAVVTSQAQSFGGAVASLLGGGDSGDSDRNQRVAVNDRTTPTTRDMPETWGEQCFK